MTQRESCLSEAYSVWHIAQNGDVFPIVWAILQDEAHQIADAMQELSEEERLPPGYYMAVPLGSDDDWAEQIKENSSPAPVDYMQIYTESLKT